MKKIIICMIFVIIAVAMAPAQIGVGTATPDSSAILDVTSTDKGFLPPRLTLSQIVAINNPANGLIVFCTTDNKFYGHVTSSKAWKEISFGTKTIATYCNSFVVNHEATYGFAPVDKTVTYATVTNIPGENGKCWIAQNLGADHQADSVDDATEASAGWYWQFNRKQGYKHDGITLTPSWTITAIDESEDWQPYRDPCKGELGSTWRLPTGAEWSNVSVACGWVNMIDPYNSVLKLHAAGRLYNADGSLVDRGVSGYYWGSTGNTTTDGECLQFYIGEFGDVCEVNSADKAMGQPIRCLRD